MAGLNRMYRIYGRLLRTRPSSVGAALVAGLNRLDADGDYGADVMERRVQQCRLSSTPAERTSSSRC